MFKKRSGAITVQMLLTMTVMLLIYGAGSIFNTINLKSVEADRSKNQTYVIDNALSAYYQVYGKQYPDSLNELQTSGLYPQNINLDKFDYLVSGSKDAYKLVVNLETGGQYVSPGSNL